MCWVVNLEFSVFQGFWFGNLGFRVAVLGIGLYLLRSSPLVALLHLRHTDFQADKQPGLKQSPLEEVLQFKLNP